MENIFQTTDQIAWIPTIITLLLTIISALISYKSWRSSVKSALESESNWREKLMDVASTANVGMNELLRIRASQRYKKNDEKKKGRTLSLTNKAQAANILWDKTYELYEKYNLSVIHNETKSIKSQEIEIQPDDQNQIRDIAIALLKYDYLNRNQEDSNEKDYSEFLTWLIDEKRWKKTENK